MKLTSGNEFRKDINGLRAIAVGLVLLFHFDVAPFQGGFVGVDVFFVISGYLMTQIILSGLQEGRFSFTHFYLRRLARILPALVCMVIAALIIGYFLLLPRNFRKLADEAMQSSTFLVNFGYAKTTGYFAASPTQSWFLHCWSLAVEFQFYIIYPILMSFAWRLGRYRAVFFLMLGLFGASLFACYLQTQNNQMEAFYLLPYRAWEFVVGGLLIFLPALPVKRRFLIQLLGVLLILTVSIEYGSAIVYPGAWAILPVLGAALVILARHDGTFISNPVAQLVGTYSYSLYLWHWLVLAVLKYIGFSPNAKLTVILFVASAVMAWLSYRLIERRFKDALTCKSFRSTVVLVGLNVIAFALCFAIIGADGMPSRISARMLDVEAKTVHRDEYRDGTCFLGPEQQISDLAAACLARQDGKPVLAIWGDSLAAHLYPGIAAQPWAKNYNIVQITASACPIVPMEVVPSRPNCPDIQKKAHSTLLAMRPDILIFAIHGGEVYAPAYVDLVKEFRANGVKNVYVIGALPRWRMESASVIQSENIGNKGQLLFTSSIANLQAILREESIYRPAVVDAGAKYLSVYDALCVKDRCSTLARGELGLSPIQSDTVHFTRQGSEWIAEHVLGPAMGQAERVRDFVLNGSLLTFDVKSRGKKYLGAGWMAPEGWGTWTSSSDRPGVLAVPVNLKQLPGSVRITYWGQLSSAFVREKFELKIMEESTRTIYVDLRNPIVTQTFVLSPASVQEMAESGLLKMEIYAREGRSSKSQGLNDDERVLGFGIRELTLMP